MVRAGIMIDESLKVDWPLLCSGISYEGIELRQTVLSAKANNQQ
jgi:hypothetical protein